MRVLCFPLMLLTLFFYSCDKKEKNDSSSSKNNQQAYSSPGSQTLAKLDKNFDKTWEENSFSLADQFVYPILLIDSATFTYELQFSKDKTESFRINTPPWENLKTIGHITPYLFTIGIPEWKHFGEKGSWKKQAKEIQLLVQKALQELDTIDFSNAAWPNKGPQLKNTMKKFLQNTDSFLSERLEQGTYTPNEVKKFLDQNTSEILMTIFFASLIGGNDATQILRKWKKELGNKWDDLYVSIYGSPGSFAGGLTLDTNSNAIILSYFMNKDKVESNLFIAPTASTISEAKQVVGDSIIKTKLANILFPTKESQDKSMGIYKELIESSLLIDDADMREIMDKLNLGLKHHPFLEFEKSE